MLEPAGHKGEHKERVVPPALRFALTAGLIASWYACNILVLLGNKYLLSNHGFKQPVFLTLCHMAACTLLGLCVSWSGFMPLKPIKSRVQFIKIVLLATIFCATIVLGNASLRFLPVSFNQAVGSTTPFFTAVFAFIFQGQREHILAYAALLPVMGGVVIGSGGEPLFHAIGFIMCLMATSGRALKTVVQSMLMTDPAEKLDPMSLLLYMSGVAMAILMPLALVLEPGALAMAVRLYNANHNFAMWMAVNAVLAYLTNLLNFLVTKYTSALTLQVLGNAKGVVAAVVSVLVFGNPVTTQGMLGYAITVTGVLLYSEAKRRAKAEAATKTERNTPSRQAAGREDVKETLLEPRSGGNSALRSDLYFRSETPTSAREREVIHRV